MWGMPMTNTPVYVYEDLDHCDMEIFTSLKKAKNYANKILGRTVVWDTESPGVWVDCENEYHRISEKVVR